MCLHRLAFTSGCVIVFAIRYCWKVPITMRRDNSYSFICINAIAGIEIASAKSIEFKLPGLPPEKTAITNSAEVPEKLWEFMQRFEVTPGGGRETKFARRLIRLHLLMMPFDSSLP